MADQRAKLTETTCLISNPFSHDYSFKNKDDPCIGINLEEFSTINFEDGYPNLYKDFVNFFMQGLKNMTKE